MNISLLKEIVEQDKSVSTTALKEYCRYLLQEREKFEQAMDNMNAVIAQTGAKLYFCRNALAWYGDTENWRIRDDRDISKAEADRGGRARAILSQYQGGIKR